MATTAQTPESDSTEIRVRGFHTDLYGHVNNARYLEFLEEGRWKLFEDRADVQELISGPVRFFVVNVNINYRRGLVVNEVAVVTTRLLRISRRSGVFRQEIRERESGALCADAEVTFVLSDGRKALPIEGEYLSMLSSLPAWG